MRVFFSPLKFRCPTRKLDLRLKAFCLTKSQRCIFLKWMLPLPLTNASLEQVLHDAGTRLLLLNSLQEFFLSKLSCHLLRYLPASNRFTCQSWSMSNPVSLQHRKPAPPKILRCRILLQLVFCRTLVLHTKLSLNLYDNNGQHTEPVWWADSRWKPDSQQEDRWSSITGSRTRWEKAQVPWLF